jgi:hypothetical protein
MDGLLPAIKTKARGGGCLTQTHCTCRAAAIVLRSSRESIIEGQHNLRAGEAGAV